MYIHINFSHHRDTTVFSDPTTIFNYRYRDECQSQGRERIIETRSYDEKKKTKCNWLLEKKRNERFPSRQIILSNLMSRHWLMRAIKEVRK